VGLRLGLRVGPVNARGWAAVLVLDCAALGAAVAIAPGVGASSAWAVLLAAVVLGAVAVVLRPLIAASAAWLGWAGVVGGWLLTQAGLVYLALSITPGIDVDGFWSAFWASWLYAALASAGLWLVTAGDSAAVVAHLARTGRRSARNAVRSDVPGVVVIQIDGLSAPVARWSVDAGNLPTLSRWIRSGGHRFVEWHARLPATTPASQAGLLHGASDRVPAFRWYEKDTGRLVVTNHPRDSAMVERRMSTGRGLLADGGVSVGNVFSGDAPVSLLTMSTIGSGGHRRGPTRELSAYLLHPYGLTRSLVLTVAEVVKELYQGRRQRLRGVQPRVGRPLGYAALRAVTNVALRELNLALVAEHMMRGAPVVFCDFVDYDEIAHHAGPVRPESLAALAGLDGVLAVLEQVGARAPRPYRFVVVSDHGQSQGATFLQRYGQRLEDLVRALTTGGEVVAVAGDDEQRARARTVLAGVADGRGPVARLGRRALGHSAPALPVRPEFVVVCSGNLGLVYFARQPGRMTAEQIEELHPGLLTGLARHPGIGFVMARTESRGPVVLGADGVHHLLDGKVSGCDPLAPFGPHAVADLLRHDSLPYTGDVLVNSSLDPAGEVAAFEELVGCHGGLGGWQSRAVLVHPADWPAEPDLVGADAVHRQLVHWLALLGHRKG